MRPLAEIPTVEEEKHLEPRIRQITKAVFGPGAVYINWRGRQGDPGSCRGRFADGLLIRHEQRDLWLIELEWEPDTNYRNQVQTFAESHVADRQGLENGLIEELQKDVEEKGCQALGLKHPSQIELIVSLIMQSHCPKNILKPKMWVVLGHAVDNIDRLVNEYRSLTRGPFRDREHLVTMVRLFDENETELCLLDNYWSTEKHTTLFGPLHYDEQESTDDVPLRTDSAYLRKPKVHKAKKVWEWFKENYPELKQENLWMRIQPGFDCCHDFEIAWKKEGKYLWVLEGNVPKRAKSVLKKVLPELDIPNSVAQKWGKYIDVSENPPKVLARFDEVDRIKRQSKGPYDRENVSREPRPCSEFFEGNTNLKNKRRLWEAFLEKRVLRTKDLVELTGITGKGRSATLDHPLTRYSIVEREGDEFRLTDEAVPYLEKMLADSDLSD